MCRLWINWLILYDYIYIDYLSVAYVYCFVRNWKQPQMAGSTPTAKLGLRSSPVSGSRSWEGHWGTTGIPLGCTHRQHEDASNRANMIKNTKVGGALYVMLCYVFLSHCMLCHVISCHVSYVMLCLVWYVMLSHVMSCYVMYVLYMIIFIIIILLYISCIYITNTISDYQNRG